MAVCMPSIKTENIKTATSSWKNVETLTITGSHKQTPGRILFIFLKRIYQFLNNAAFNNLQELNLNLFDGSDLVSWSQIIANNPKLKIIRAELIYNQEKLNLNEMITSARGGMKLIMRGNFKLTEERRLQFKENSWRGVRLYLPKKK